MLTFGDCRELIEKADHLRSTRRLNEAVTMYSEAVTETARRCPEADDWRKLLALAYNNRGQARYLQVDFTGAVLDYTRALEVCDHGDTMTVALYNRGLIHYRLGRFDSAVDDMKGALQLDSSFSSAKHCLEQSLIDKQQRLNRGCS